MSHDSFHHHRRGGIPVTVNSTLVLLALLLACCSVSAVLATLKAQSDPTWTGAHTLLGAVCAASTFFLALLAVGNVLWRRRRPPEA